MKKTKIAIIPARGGSKRLPRKNILPVMQRPLITYPLQAAIDSQIFDQVIVSSEDNEILDISSVYECRQIKRPQELAIDSARVVEVCSHVLETLAQENQTPDYFCLIYATALFLTPDDIKKSFLLLQQEPFPDVVMGVSEYNLQPMQALYKDADGFLKAQWPKENQKQSQKYPDFVASNGTLYWSKTNAFTAHQSFYPEKLKGYVIPKYRAIDIDTFEDYSHANMIAPILLDIPPQNCL